MLGVGNGLFQTAVRGRPGSAPPILDTLTGAAFAFSPRRLRTGANLSMRVRRSSDNAEADFGFTPAGDLDTAAMLSFCGVGDGFVTTQYDQTVNARNAVQTTAANQHPIVIGGVLNTVNNRPMPRLDGINHFMDINAPIALGCVSAVLNALDVGTFGDFDGIVSGGTTATWVATGSTANLRAMNNVGTPVINGISAVNFAPLSDLKVAVTNDIVTAAEPLRWRIGQDRGLTARRWNGNIAEVIAFPALLSTADRQTLERNQGAYFNIPVA